MDFEWLPLAEDIRHGIRQVCALFDDEYWEEKDRNREFPWGQLRHGPPEVVLQ